MSLKALSMLLLPDFSLLGYQASNAEVRFLLCRQTALEFFFNPVLLRSAEKQGVAKEGRVFWTLGRKEVWGEEDQGEV